MESTVNERIALIISEFKFKSKRAFAEKIGIAQTSFNDILKGAEPKYSTLYKILKAEPLISSDWLLLGKGDMIKEDINKENTEIISLKKELEESKKEIFRLEGENSIMREQLGLSQRKNGKTA